MGAGVIDEGWMGIELGLGWWCRLEVELEVDEIGWDGKVDDEGWEMVTGLRIGDPIQDDNEVDDGETALRLKIPWSS